MAVAKGYRNFIFLSDKYPILRDNIKVNIIITKTIPIAPIGFANSGKI